MDVPSIVIDTNVLVAGLRSRRGVSARLLELVGRAAIEINVSVPVVLEYEAVLKRSGMVPPYDARTASARWRGTGRCSSSGGRSSQIRAMRRSSSWPSRRTARPSSPGTSDTSAAPSDSASAS